MNGFLGSGLVLLRLLCLLLFKSFGWGLCRAVPLHKSPRLPAKTAPLGRPKSHPTGLGWPTPNLLPPRQVRRPRKSETAKAT